MRSSVMIEAGSHSVSPVVGLFQGRRGGDVASADFFDFFTLVGVHLQSGDRCASCG